MFIVMWAASVEEMDSAIRRLVVGATSTAQTAGFVGGMASVTSSGRREVFVFGC